MVIPKRASSIHLKVAPVSHAIGYVWAHKHVDDTQWEYVHTTSANVFIPSLISGQRYHFKVAALGSHPSRIWSDEISSFIL